MVLKTVQKIVIAVAVTDLDRHAAVSSVPELGKDRLLLKLRIRRDIDGMIRRLLTDFHKLCKKRTEIVSFHDLSEPGKLRIGHFADYHDRIPLYITFAEHITCKTPRSNIILFFYENVNRNSCIRPTFCGIIRALSFYSETADIHKMWTT